jgi:hypothetical protein
MAFIKIKQTDENSSFKIFIKNMDGKPIHLFMAGHKPLK